MQTATIHQYVPQPGVWNLNNQSMQCMQTSTINQLTSGGHKSIPREHLPQAWRLESINAMQNATTNQLTSGGHKSIPREHLPQVWSLEK
jgi:hypothetical protein